MARFEAGFVAFNKWLLILILATMSVIIFANVGLRYLTSQSIEWAEEVARHMMIWVTFLGSGLVLRFGGHGWNSATQPNSESKTHNLG